ncbi:MAG TPA: glutamate--tRNA ligase [Anaerolineaceae bacterium]|nr:glutamate--tRNA ligase [Anaerolineaceae bacterium]HQJ33272.1 glutamate--tRNA ligase [Anaerolineaceae bacterium]
MFRTRFAPSPTGYMHIGNLRTALYAYLIAKKAGGKFILRIEDTDQSRNVPEAVAAIYRGLALAGISYDEGPDKDGGFGPYVQSERLPIYKTYAQKLLASGHAYYCFCSKEDKPALEASNERVEGYRDPCRNLTPQEVEARFAEGLVPVVRQRIPLEGISSFDDHVYGHIAIENKQLDDQVLLKSDGFPTYNFANVVDDHLMEISHVIRGQEYLSSTPKYNLLYEAFGWQHPEYIHLPHIIREDGAKMSKRKGDPSFEDLVRMGFLPQAIVNYVALLGWNPGDEREFFLMEDLIAAFDMDRINKANAAFSIDKLRWLNAEHIRSLSPEAFHQIALPFYPEGLKGFDLAKISQLIQIRTEILTDIPRLVGFLAELPEYSAELFENQKSKSTLESSRVVLEKTLPLLEKLENWSNEGLFEVLKAFAQEQGFKVGTVMWPIRATLSGQETSPGGATELAALLGKEESLRRIKLGLSKLQ